KSSQEIAAILSACRSKTSSINITPQNAESWANASQGFAKAIGVAAKELGVATNDFLNSPAGYLLAAILIVNFVGNIIFGVPVPLASLVFMWILFKYLWTKSKDYENVPVLWGFWSIRKAKVTKYEYLSEGKYTIMVIAALMCVILNGIVWVNLS